MGGGRWTEDTRASYRSYASTASTKSVHETFTSKSIKSELDPKGVMLRESVDSVDNPNSTAIIVGVDVTGSMGVIAHEMAKQGLGTLIEGILDRLPVEDPHIMFMAIGDAAHDSSPLQVSQFEADARIIEQLAKIYVEQGGGGNDTESYDLPWYFAGTRTKTDCFNKRGKKGYLFTIGDENPPAGLTESQIKRVFGTSDQRGFSAAELLAMADEKYHVFHLVVEQGSYCKRNPQAVIGKWTELMGKRALPLSNYNHVSQVILAAIEISEGKDPEEVITGWQDKSVVETIRHALRLED